MHNGFLVENLCARLGVRVMRPTAIRDNLKQTSKGHTKTNERHRHHFEVTNGYTCSCCWSMLWCLANFEIQGMSASLFVFEPFCLCQCSPTSIQINRPFQILYSFRFFWFFIKIESRKPLHLQEPQNTYICSQRKP